MRMYYLVFATLLLGMGDGYAMASETVPEQITPPAVVIVAGACPFEGCPIGRWVAAQATIPVYNQPDGALKQELLRRGDVIFATDTEVRAVPR